MGLLPRRAALVALILRELVQVRLDLARAPLDRALTRPVPRRRRPASPDELHDLADTTDLILRRVRATRVTCLPRALVRYRLLVRLGAEPVFKMGVRPSADGDVVGHAWVELDGTPFAERESTDYTVTLIHGAAE